MPAIKPITPYLARSQRVLSVIAPPYDVISHQLASVVCQTSGNSFLHITRPDADFPADACHTSDKVYQHAKDELKRFIEEELFVLSDTNAYCLYEVQVGAHKQVGLFCLSDARSLKKHEHTRPDKITDRFNLSENLKAQVSPVLLTIKENQDIKNHFHKLTQKLEPLYNVNFKNTTHKIYLIESREDKIDIEALFANAGDIYIADGHHRVHTHIALNEKYPKYYKESILSVIFLSDELNILGYHRVVDMPDDINTESLITTLEKDYDLSESNKPVFPNDKDHFGLFIDKLWYRLDSKSYDKSMLAVELLHQNIIEPIFNITDVQKDSRISFLSGVDMVDQLNGLSDAPTKKVAFTLSPISMKEIINIADEDKVLPPKSTWFEPKLLDGFLFHRDFEDDEGILSESLSQR